MSNQLQHEVSHKPSDVRWQKRQRSIVQNDVCQANQRSETFWQSVITHAPDINVMKQLKSVNLLTVSNRAFSAAMQWRYW